MATAAIFLLCGYGVRGHILWLGEVIRTFTSFVNLAVPRCFVCSYKFLFCSAAVLFICLLACLSCISFPLLPTLLDLCANA